jgi:hypothetical protein
MFVVVGDDLKILLIIYRKVFDFSATSFIDKMISFSDRLPETKNLIVFVTPWAGE